MEKINIGIISNIRKIRLAFRTLLLEHPQSPAKIVLEGPSIETVGSQTYMAIKPEVLLLDYRLVFKDSNLFFALTRDLFGNIPILLLVDQFSSDQAKRCQHDIHSLLPIELDSTQLFATIKNAVGHYTYTS